MRDRMEGMWTVPNIYERRDGTHMDFCECIHTVSK